jgi:hypothetical protein
VASNSFISVNHFLPALRLRTIILETTLPFAEILQLPAKTEVAGSFIQGATTVLCTLLIALYLVFQQWRQRKLIGTELWQGDKNN